MEQPNTGKPIDRLSPHCTDAWANMEEWGGGSWFPKDDKNDNKHPDNCKCADCCK